jgi:hypothetical protein
MSSISEMLRASVVSRSRLIALVLLSIGASGCERVVQVTAPDSTPRLVVEARLERVRGAVTGNQSLRLSTSSAYFSNTVSPAVSGAAVRVADDSGRVVAFTESSTEPGLYTTSSLIVGLNRKYTLRITYKGSEYAATEAAQTGVAMDSLYFRSAVNPFGPKNTLRATIALRDPVGVENYYTWDQYVDGKRLTTSDTTLNNKPLVSDEAVDGFQFDDLQPYDAIAVRPGQLVRVRQFAISRQSWRFFQALNEQGANDGSPFGVPPASLRGNIANVTVPGDFAFGYFSVGEVTELSRRVP